MGDVASSLRRDGEGMVLFRPLARTASAYRLILWALLLLSVICIALGAVHQFMNGDEFIFLSQIYRAHNGWPLALSQTAYVHLFNWLPLVGRDEADQVIIGRLSLVPLWIASLFLLHRIGSRLLDPTSALAGVTLFALFSYCLMSAASFRIDGLLLPALLAVAALLLAPGSLPVIGAGALAAVALALSLKAVLWAPTLFGLLLLGLRERKVGYVPAAGAAAVFVCCYLAIQLGHSWLISTPASPMPGFSGHGLAHVAGFMFFRNGLLPKAAALHDAIIGNIETWLLILAGLCVALADLRRRDTRPRAIRLLLLFLPILSVLFYANAFPYAYVFLIPGACLLAGWAFARFLTQPAVLNRAGSALALLLAAAPLAALLWANREPYPLLTKQKQDIVLVHRLFGRPVPYIDTGGMIASFPGCTPPVTALGLSSFRARGVPVVAQAIARCRPPLLVANSPSLDLWDPDVAGRLAADLTLLPADQEAIRQTYALYWNDIYLAGRRWTNLGPGADIRFSLRIPGEYTLISLHPAMIDGVERASGTSLHFEAGSQHFLTTTGAEPDLRILWGRGLALPPGGPA